MPSALRFQAPVQGAGIGPGAVRRWGVLRPGRPDGAELRGPRARRM